MTRLAHRASWRSWICAVLALALAAAGLHGTSAGRALTLTLCGVVIATCVTIAVLGHDGGARALGALERAWWLALAAAWVVFVAVGLPGALTGMVVAVTLLLFLARTWLLSRR